MNNKYATKPFTLSRENAERSKGMNTVGSPFGAISQTLLDQFHSVMVMIAQFGIGQLVNRSGMESRTLPKAVQTVSGQSLLIGSLKSLMSVRGELQSPSTVRHSHRSGRTTHRESV